MDVKSSDLFLCQRYVGYNVEADTTEIVVSFHCCDRSDIVVFVLTMDVKSTSRLKVTDIC
jgi:hypothetical protein